MHNREALHQKAGKANFDLIYDLEDPREYFSTLGQFDYRIPQHGQSVFSELIEARRDASRDGNGVPHSRVVDVCCSYGINAALLKYETTLEEMYARYGSGELADLSSEELAEDDAAFYGARRREASPEVVGLDVAQNAVAYGLRSGILDAGFAENLEEDEPTEALGRAVAGADLLTVTGGIGYVTERTFEQLLERMIEGSEGRVPWIAAFALRWVSYDRISEVLSDYGLVTEKLAGRTFTQRRFTDDAEREYVLEELMKMGVDTTGKEDTGWYHANFYLSRPAEEAKIPPEVLLRKS
jgi:SAM-dependent methyltransferase